MFYLGLSEETNFCSKINSVYPKLPFFDIFYNGIFFLLPLIGISNNSVTLKFQIQWLSVSTTLHVRFSLYFDFRKRSTLLIGSILMELTF